MKENLIFLAIFDQDQSAYFWKSARCETINFIANKSIASKLFAISGQIEVAKCSKFARHYLFQLIGDGSTE